MVIFYTFSVQGQVKKEYNITSNHQQQIPVLCYHNIKASMEGQKFAYTIATKQFQAHIQMLADSGFHPISPNQLYNHLTRGDTLPRRPVMITFDDSRVEHFSIAAPILEAVGFRGVFFIMTITIGKSGYMTATQIKQLADNGHTIASHTLDHPDVRKLNTGNWDVQVNGSKQTLEQITGKPVLYFAYPFGAWNEAAIGELKKRGIQAAFQLSTGFSHQSPLYTIRRLMVPGNWSAASLYQQIQQSFK